MDGVRQLIPIVPEIMDFFKNIIGLLFSAGKMRSSEDGSPDRANESAYPSRLKDPTELPDVCCPFKLVWSIARDENDQRILYFEFETDGGVHLYREVARFEDWSRAKQLVALFIAKYEEKLSEIYLAPGVGIYVGGDDNAGWANFIDFVTEQGYERVMQDVEYVKRDGATREILAPETIFRIRSTDS